MKVKTIAMCCAGVVLAMFVLSGWALVQLPSDARIAVHFSFDGTPDRWASRVEGLFILPVIAAVTAALLAIVPRIDPRGGQWLADTPWYAAISLATIAMLASAHVGLVESALTGIMRPGAYIAIPLAGLCLVLGRFLGRSRSNFFVGVRTPWTLSSEYSWRRSNALAARGFTSAGLAGVLTFLVRDGAWAVRVLLGSMVTVAVVATFASYYFWRKERDHQQDPPEVAP